MRDNKATHKRKVSTTAKATRNKTMNAKKINTYTYNFVGGVTPAHNDVKYDYDVLVSSDNGDYKKAVARLEIKNGESVAEYVARAESEGEPTGYYVEGVGSWYMGHQYLIDLVQGMAEELVRNTPVGCNVKEYTAIINESYADGTYIDYVVDLDMDAFDEHLYIDCSDSLEGEVADEETLRQLINISAEDLYDEYL